MLRKEIMEVRDRIQQKAEELFRRYGTRSITMDEIASQLGVSKKTIYQFFADKDELVLAVMTQIIDNSQDKCAAYPSKAKNAVHELFLIMEMMKELFKNMNPSILYDIERSHPKAFQKFLEHKNQFVYRMIKDNLARGIEEGLYRPELDQNLIARLRLETMMMSFNPQYFANEDVNVLDVERKLIEHFLFGISNLKGHKLIIKYEQDRIKKEKDDQSKKVK